MTGLRPEYGLSALVVAKVVPLLAELHVLELAVLPGADLVAEHVRTVFRLHAADEPAHRFLRRSPVARRADGDVVAASVRREIAVVEIVPYPPRLHRHARHDVRIGIVVEDKLHHVVGVLRVARLAVRPVRLHHHRIDVHAGLSREANPVGHGLVLVVAPGNGAGETIDPRLDRLAVLEDARHALRVALHFPLGGGEGERR